MINTEQTNTHINNQKNTKTVKEWTTLEQDRQLKQNYGQDEVLPFTPYKEGTMSLIIRRNFNQS